MSPDRKPDSINYDLMTSPDRPKAPEVSVTGRVVNIREYKKNGRAYHVLVFSLPNGSLKRVTLFGRGTEVDMKITKDSMGFWNLDSITKHEPRS